MTRGLDSATATAAQAAAHSPVGLVKLEFPGGDVCLWTGLGTLAYNGDTYTGAGDLGFIGPIDEDTDLTRNTLEVGLRGIPNDVVSIAFNQQYQGQPATVYLGYLDPDTGQLVGPPAAFSGKMDFPTITLGKECQVRLAIEDEFAVLDRPRSRRYNGGDQQARYPGDRGLEFVEQATEKQINWGQPG